MMIRSIRINDIRMSYGAKEVIAGVSLALEPGVTAIMGHNGCGKSTLIRIAALLEEPTSGAVRYMDEAGDELAHDMALRRRVTMVQSKAGLFNSSVLYNAAFGLTLRGVAKTEANERAMEILKQVGLDDKAHQNALSLSSGEQQRLAIARAMVIGPDVLMLDEPTASVDEENTAIIESLIERLGEGNGEKPIVLLATHDRPQAERLASKVYTMSRGRLSAPGS